VGGESRGGAGRGSLENLHTMLIDLLMAHDTRAHVTRHTAHATHHDGDSERRTVWRWEVERERGAIKERLRIESIAPVHE